MVMGTVRIKLGELLQERQLSKNKFAQRAELERTQLNRYINNEVALLSVDVLARMCSTLNCKIEDLLEYTEE
jgi:putative transcriptional regulator